MPLYRFECPVCGIRFDERLSYNGDIYAVTCPAGHTGVRRLFSPPAIVFKGSGFYVTDKRKSSGKVGCGEV